MVGRDLGDAIAVLAFDKEHSTEDFPDLSSQMLSACSQLRQGSRGQRRADTFIAASSAVASFQNLPQYPRDSGSIVFVR